MTDISSTSKNWRQMLLAVPAHNQAATIKEQGDCITVIVKNKRPSYMVPPVSWFVPYRPQKEIKLDPVGTLVWKLCDGKNTVENVVDHFKDTYDLTFHEAKTSVTDYLKKLVQRGVLAVVIQNENNRQE